MANKHFKIFLDFDGTITRSDVGEEIFRLFLDNGYVNKIVGELLDEKISSRECWEKLCESAGTIDKKELDKLILSQQVEPGFQHFVHYCEAHSYELFVLSDGFNYYIEKILARENLDHLKVYSNELIIDQNGKIKPSFPYYSEDCRSSANCKRNHIIENSGEDDYTVFIGDGNSDKDPVQYVDFIFAKDELLKYCEMQNITFFPFTNFDDVIVRLEKLSSGKRLKKRYQAELKRRQAYLVE